MSRFQEFLLWVNQAGGNEASEQATFYVYPGKVEIQFHGWALVILCDGKWYPIDTSGG